MNVLVLLGGSSNERAVSLRSGGAVSQALKALGHEALEYDPQKGYAGLKAFVGKVDVVLPILHGWGGEDGEVQRELDKLGFKYLGSSAAVSAVCFDKVATLKKFKGMGLNIPPGEVVDRKSINDSKFIKKPYVLKPIRGGSTLDTFIIHKPQEQSYDPTVFDNYDTMLLEELIYGTEITVPVVGHKALPVIEIIPPEGGEFDYENKYNGASQELSPPVSVSKPKQLEAQKIAEATHRTLGARHLSRTDMILDSSGKLWVLEINTMPGLTPQSLLPKSAAASGLSFEDLVERFVEMANS